MANEGMESDVESTLVAIARHINGLNEQSKFTRKRAIEGLRKEIVLKKPELGGDALQKVFAQIWTPLLQVLADSSDKCRELSVNILAYCINNASQPVNSLPYVIPVLVQRLGNTDPDKVELIEGTEEIRLELVNLLTDIIKKCKTDTGPYVDDIVNILQRTVVDPCADVIKQSCKCVALYAQTTPQQFHMKSEAMIKPLSKSISHQHSRVRVEVIHAIGSVIQHGNNKSVDDVVSHLAQRLFDTSPLVREAVVQVVGHWLLDLMDRYSFFHKLIPLLLTGLEDDMPGIREKAESLWHDVGLKYEGENEKDLKDQMDFSKPPPEHYPPGMDRPNLGCRTLMYHHFSKILSGINNDISDWQAPSRIKAAQLLYTLLINMEQNATMHLEKIVHALVKGSSDEEDQVVEYVEKCSVMIGYFVPPEVWVKLVLKQLKLYQNPGLLRILSNIIVGSQKKTLSPFLPDICSSIGDSQICQVADLQQQRQLCSCLASIIKVAGSECENVSLELFAIILALRALARSAEIDEKSVALFSGLAQIQGMSSKEDLFARHGQEMVDRLEENSASWTQHSTDRLLFDALLTESGPVIGELLDSVMPILQANLQPIKDVEVRLKFFKLLSQLLINADTTVNASGKFSQEHVRGIIEDIIMPNCTWRAGRTAGALRTVAISCLWALLHDDKSLDKSLVAPETLIALADPLVTQLQSMLEDDSPGTRLVTSRVLTRIFQRAGRGMDLDKLHQFYPELLKRLDDGNDDVRVATCGTFIAYLSCFSDDYQVPLWRAHYEAIYRGLLVHLDDPERRIQAEVQRVLEASAEIAPQMLLREIEAVKHKHRSTHFCDALAEYVHALPKPGAGDA